MAEANSDESSEEAFEEDALIVPHVIPPLNFSIVAKGLYRSGYPNKKNHSFLKRIGLRTNVYLCEEEYSADNHAFLQKNNIALMHYPIHGNKEPFQDMPISIVRDIIVELLDTRNHPVLMHCAKGKHRTGTIIGCLRKMQRWSLTFIFDEYKRFAGQKARALDQEFIELFPLPLFRRRTPAVAEREAYLAPWIDKDLFCAE